MSCLAPCPACGRHVSTHETACPFCAAALPETFRCQPARVAPPRRLSRAARIAAGAALMSASCFSGTAVYGAPIDPDAGPPKQDTGADSSTSDGSDDGVMEAQLAAPPPASDSRAPSPEPKKM